MGWWSLATTALWLACGLVVLRSLFSFRELLAFATRWWRAVEGRLHLYQSYEIPMYNESLQENPLYRKATTYISSLPSLEDSSNALLLSSVYPSSSKRPNSYSDLYLKLGTEQTVYDSFLGSRISWTNHSGDALVLRVRKLDRRRVLRPYLQHIESVVDEIELRRREVRLFTNSVGLADGSERRRWRSVPFNHPSTMDTLAMDPELKNRVRSDLESFLKNKLYYHRLGRVWKRSYLLHGPPGTGKSSFVAAMAKFLGYDIYDLDLGRVSDGSDLKVLLLQTSPRSVIVVEDLDQYLQGGASKLVGNSNTLSGVLNFMDGIFSCCGEERVMVFTMREMAVAAKETGAAGIDPAVLRAGRLDVHLHFPLCDFTAFKTMANSYLGLKDHKLYPAVEEIFQSGASLSQAEIGEIMIANRGSPSRALKTVINALQQSSAGAAARRVSGFFSNISGPRKKLSESASWNEHRGGGGGGEEMGDIGNEAAGVLGSNGALNKEFKRFYGFIRRGGSKKEGHGQQQQQEQSPPPPPPLPPVPQQYHHRKQLSSSSLDLPPPSSDNNNNKETMLSSSS